MPTEISGSTGVNKIQDNTIVNADINSSAAIAGSKISGGTGKVLQIKTAQFTGSVTTMSSDWVALPDQLAITPLSATSKLYVTCQSSNVWFRNAQFGYQIFRDGNQTSSSSNFWQGFVHNSSSNNINIPVTIPCVVTSGNTNSTTFRLYTKGSGDYHKWQDDSSGDRLMVIMEIEA